LNYPEVINAINLARVPQRAQGSYPETSNSKAPQINIKTDNSDLKSSIDMLNNLIRGGLIAKISYDHLKQEQKKIDDIENDVSR